MNITAHMFSSGGVVLHEGKVLTISSAVRKLIGIPKGAIDQGESVEQAAIREVKEETGYDVRIIKKLDEYTFEFDWTDGEHYIKTVTYYLMELLNDLPPAANLQPGEDFEVKWLDINDAMKLFTYDEARDALGLAVKAQASK